MRLFLILFQILEKEILFLKDRINRILSDRTGKTVNAIDKDTNRDNFMSSDDALKYGLIDQIVESKK